MLHWVGIVLVGHKNWKSKLSTEKSLTNFPSGYDHCWSGWQLFLALSTQRWNTIFQNHQRSEENLLIN